MKMEILMKQIFVRMVLHNDAMINANEKCCKGWFSLATVLVRVVIGSVE